MSKKREIVVTIKYTVVRRMIYLASSKEEARKMCEDGEDFDSDHYWESHPDITDIEDPEWEECEKEAKAKGLRLDKNTIPIIKKDSILKRYRNWQGNKPEERDTTSYSIDKTFIKNKGKENGRK